MEELSARNGPEPGKKPLEGDTLHDVGRMKVPYDDVQVSYVDLPAWYWDLHYTRPPAIQTPQ